jgi:ABC-2 type transport system ATP-binding protein
VVTPPLVLQGIVKRWPGVPVVLDGIDLTLERGAAVAIVGSNGAGKTTLLRIAAGLIAPERGAVRVEGLDPERDRAGFQGRAGLLSAGNTGLYARLSPAMHLELWARLALLPRPQRQDAIARARDDFALDPIWDRRVDRLSMGQRQRVRLARAFLHSPAVVLLDEPATSLDDDGTAMLGAAVEALKARGGAALACVPSHWELLPRFESALVLSGGALEPA